MSNVLGPRDINAQMKPASPEKKAEKSPAKSLREKREELRAKLKNGDKTQQYISPSDSIQSPATAKVNAMRNKHIQKKAKPKTLFETASSKKIESAKDTLSFPDVPKKDQDLKLEDIPLAGMTLANDVVDQNAVYAPDLNRSPAFHLNSVEEAQKQQKAITGDYPGENDQERDPEDGDEQKKA